MGMAVCLSVCRAQRRDPARCYLVVVLLGSPSASPERDTVALARSFWRIIMTRNIKRITVFGGSSEGKVASFMKEASALGEEFARRGIEYVHLSVKSRLLSRDCSLVYGGGSVGLMGAAARAAAAGMPPKLNASLSHSVLGGSKVTGIIPRALMPRELSGEGIGEVIVTESMHDRKVCACVSVSVQAIDPMCPLEFDVRSR